MEFEYKAVNEAGEEVDGAIHSHDRRSAISALAESGYFVTTLDQKGHQISGEDGSKRGKVFSFGKSVSAKDILSITNQLSTALRAGLPLLNCLEIIKGQQKAGATHQLLEELVAAVRAGESLSEAMGKHPHIFSPLYISLIRVGETGGILEQTTTQLGDLLKRDEHVKSNLKSASIYPVFVLCVGLLSVVIVITWILPRILGTIAGGMAVMPWPTRMLMGISDFIKGWWWLIVVVSGGAILYWKNWKNSEMGLLAWDKFKLDIPILGSVLRSIAVGRFARTLGELTKGGIIILQALSVVRDTLGNEVLARDIDEVIEKVRTGSSLAEPLGRSGNFPQLLVQIVSVGEQTGKLDEMLLNAADAFDTETDAAITRFTAIFPAILIMSLALIIGFIVAATLLPIITMELGAGGV